MNTSGKIYAVIKRFLDIAFSSVLLCMLSIPMLLIWLAVKLDSRGSGIFRQIRVGKNCKPFVCFKFRTMYESAPRYASAASLEEADKYITRVGRFLRRSSLDELPQLFNVLRGDMSIVGPRPLIIAEKNIHDKRRENGVYGIRPGITGLSQVNGRNALSDERKAELDTQYLLKWGFVQDLKIIGRTVIKVMAGADVERQKGHF